MNENSQTFLNNKNTIKFPIEAKQKNPEILEGDTLIAKVDNTNFTITPTGKIFWGQNPSDTFQLNTNMIIEKVYLLKSEDTLFCFYTETDFEGATSRLEKINLKTKQQIFNTEIQGLNLGLPYILNSFVYVTTIGFVGKINLNNGNYAYQHFGLYDKQKFSFNSFDTILLNDSFTIFISNNYHSKRIDSLLVNEKTGEKIIKK